DDGALLSVRLGFHSLHHGRRRRSARRHDHPRGGDLARIDPQMPRIIAVPTPSRRERELNHVRALPPETRTDLEKFFVATDELEDKELEFEGWIGPKRALRLVKQCEKRFAKRKV